MNGAQLGASCSLAEGLAGSREAHNARQRRAFSRRKGQA